MAAVASNRISARSALDSARANTFGEALGRLLSTRAAELTFAEILDGLPTEASFQEFNLRDDESPVFRLRHTSLCPGITERTRDFRAALDPLALTFPPAVLAAFQQSCPGTRRFELRLIELLAIACHSMAVYLYNLDDGAHKHDDHGHAPTSPGARALTRQPDAPLTPFYHRSYRSYQQYPNGMADVVGYWAEAKIFGGVVLFDRGESGNECRNVFLHPARFKGARTIFPPTPVQYDSLISFLLGPAGHGRDADADADPCPIPIYPTSDNRWRYDPWDSMTRFSIFRDRYERPVPSGPKPLRRVNHYADWPELIDDFVITDAQLKVLQGEPVDRTSVNKALDGLRQITPSSPVWDAWCPLNDPETSADFAATLAANLGIGDSKPLKAGS